jgi:hypothetical protein
MGLLFIPQMIYGYRDTMILAGKKKTKNLEKNLPQCHFVYHKSHMG